jgi:transposase
MPYGLDLRKRVMSALQSGMSKKTVIKTFQICKQTIYNWIALEEKQGHLKPITGFQNGHSHGITDEDAFKKFVDEHADYTHEEIAKHFNVGSSTAGRMLKKLGYSRKKRVKHMQKETMKNEKNFSRK